MESMNKPSIPAGSSSEIDGRALTVYLFARLVTSLSIEIFGRSC